MRYRYILLFFAFCLSFGTLRAQEYYKIGEQVSLFNEVCRRLQNMYVDTLNPEQMITDAIRGMTAKMDPYTEFYSAKDKERLNRMLTGKYAGIGAIIKYCQDKKHVVIDYPYANTPASGAGFEMGDVILAIDDTTMLDRTTEFVSSHLRGEAGTQVKVKVKKRADGKVVTKTITRETIKLPEIPTSFVMNIEGKKVGVINLSEFTQGCYDNFKSAFLDLKRKGMERLVIDIRGNGGGSVQEAVDIINMFIARGELVVQTRGKNAQLDHEYKTTKDPADLQIPLIVLVDDDSASASEILAGCLQDLDRAKIVGVKTYGKGITQQTLPLQNDAEMKITVSRYYLPSGRCIQARNYNKGKAESVADSLKHVFYTRNGREVVDGSGIAPDIEIKADTLPRIVYYLNVADSTELIHNFVCSYLNKHKDIPMSEHFSLADADYDEFKQMVIAADFKYDPFTEKVLKNLKEVAEVEGYYNNSKAEFEALENKLKHNLDYDLDFNKKQIKSLLEYYIMIGKHGYSEGLTNNYKYDNVFLKAVKEF
ncbi:MAG: S41 family peptidase [Prevotella sp.]|nr:S41 family peptidase [Prevotella sp.]